jgi:hypothetical protein
LGDRPIVKRGATQHGASFRGPEIGSPIFFLPA